MNKEQFLQQLAQELLPLKKEERQRWLDDYSELLADRMEEGMTETEAVAAVGAPESVAEQILEDAGIPELLAARRRRNRKIMLATSPLWVSIGIVALAAVWIVVAMMFVVCAALYASALTIAASSVACVGAMAVFVFTGSPVTGILMLGSGLVLAGLSLLLWMGTHRLAKLMVRGSRWIAARIKKGLLRIIQKCSGKECAV